jgi:hypothetical protein
MVELQVGKPVLRQQTKGDVGRVLFLELTAAVSLVAQGGL